MPHARSLSLTLVLAAGVGCGNPGPPAPPSLLLPQPAGDLAAERTGDTVTLHWTNPVRSTDRVPLRGPRRVSVCRAVGGGPCEPAGTANLAADAPGRFEDTLPAKLRAGPLRLLTYRVRLLNARGADAGASNPACAAAGAAPPAVTEARAQATARGVRVEWTIKERAEAAPEAARRFARIERAAVPPRGEPDVLESKENANWWPGETLDRAAPLDARYGYRVTLVEQASLEGHRVEIVGASAVTPPFLARDTFAPAAPEGLEAVANPQSQAIDLSWTASAEPDLRGYYVYRAASGEPWVRVSGPKPLPSPAYTDAAVQPGVRYGYSVSAVDASGNESARSGEAAETLP